MGGPGNPKHVQWVDPEIHIRCRGWTRKLEARTVGGHGNLNHVQWEGSETESCTVGGPGSRITYSGWTRKPEARTVVGPESRITYSGRAWKAESRTVGGPGSQITYRGRTRKPNHTQRKDPEGLIALRHGWARKPKSRTRRWLGQQNHLARQVGPARVGGGHDGRVGDSAAMKRWEQAHPGRAGGARRPWW